MGGCSSTDEADPDASRQVVGPEEMARVETLSRPKILCLHGWRTNGDILSMQMAALQANTDMECLFIDAPFPGRGEPDKGIAIFYPDRPYYEWFYRTKVAEISDNIKTNSFAGYDNLEESMNYLKDYLESNGPYDGLLGFSQGASMVTRLVNQEEELMRSSSSVQEIPFQRKFEFVILIGGVPPQELIDIHEDIKLTTPSLHIMGEIDPLLSDSLLLEKLYHDNSNRRNLRHDEGHNIPSIRTNLYPKIQEFLTLQMTRI